jgi:hypothetical protein
VLSRELIRSERIALTLPINGYDDGLSTGECSRFLGDCLGPSDFRKERARSRPSCTTCDERLVKLLDLRFPDEYGFEQARASFAQLREGGLPAADEFQRTLRNLVGGSTVVPPTFWRTVSIRFEQEACPHRVPVQLRRLQPGQSGFRRMLPRGRRDFNHAVEDYTGLMGIPAGMIENVTTVPISAWSRWTARESCWPPRPT